MINRQLLTAKSLLNYQDIKPERVYLHAKEVEANCKKALALCMSSSLPYKSFHAIGKYPSGTNWYDYVEWLRTSFYKRYECSPDDNDIESEDEGFNEEDADEEPNNDSNNNSKESNKEPKANNNKKGEDSSYSDEASSNEDSSSSNEEAQKDDLPIETYFKGFFSFVIWGYIPPPGFEKLKSMSMNAIAKPNNVKDKQASRENTKKEEAERKANDALLDQRGELAFQQHEKKISDILVKGRLEMQQQQLFTVKSDNIKDDITFINDMLKDLREEYLMLDAGNLSEKNRIRNEMASLRNEKTTKYNSWKQLCAGEESRRDNVNSDWNSSLKASNETQLKKAATVISTPITLNEKQCKPTSTLKNNNEHPSGNDSDSSIKLFLNNDKEPGKINATPKKLVLEKSPRKSNSNDVDVVIVKKKAGHTVTQSDVSSMIEEMETEESKRNDKIDSFMKDAMECDSIANNKAVITYLKRDHLDCFPLTNCFFCNGELKTSHYCLHPCDDSNIIDEKYGTMICGKAMCLDCRTSWGNADNYENRCVAHGDKPTITPASTKKVKPKAKSTLLNNKRKSSRNGKNDGGGTRNKVKKTSDRKTPSRKTPPRTSSKAGNRRSTRTTK